MDDLTNPHHDHPVGHGEEGECCICIDHKCPAVTADMLGAHRLYEARLNEGCRDDDPPF